MTTTNLVMRLLITWIIPGGLAILIGMKKNRLGLGVLVGVLFGALGFFFGLGLGWLGMIVVCCFKKRTVGKES